MYIYNMSSDRNLYDQGAYLSKTAESSKPINWVLDINASESCQVCGDQPNVLEHTERIRRENDIFGLNRKLTKDPKKKYQKNDRIADSSNFSPAFLCERNIKNKDFLNQNSHNDYMEDLRKLSPSDVRTNDTSENMCKLTNYVKSTDLNFSYKV